VARHRNVRRHEEDRERASAGRRARAQAGFDAPAAQAGLSMQVENLIHEGLGNTVSALAYCISRTLTSLYPQKVLLETTDPSFDLEAYAAAGQCRVMLKPSVHPQISTYWRDAAGKGLGKCAENAWFEVSWQGHRLEAVLMSWSAGCGSHRCWLLADSMAVSESFFLTVSEWGAEVRREVLVFDDGGWEKSDALYQAIQMANFDNLILRGSLKQQIREDFARFLAARATYERYGVPWKRGILFIGPPGNGKTHAVKALLNSVDYPCLYVKSFGHSHSNVRCAFDKARSTTPCVLVLEDLDSLVNEWNRSYFLNELDGFALNTGILTLATTNHPERLDPAILARPSRFDRKYHFELPAPAERWAYIVHWNGALEPEMRLSEAGLARVAHRTEGFSFAYLKELVLSAMMDWLELPRPGEMDAVIDLQLDALREQMNSTPGKATSELESDEAEVRADEDEG
jgi:ATPase family associated with various cellular activities (AAA)